MKTMTDLEYIELYAQKLKEDNRYFEQQRRFIESQLKASSSFFKNKFGNDFKKNARIYLREIGLIK